MGSSLGLALKKRGLPVRIHVYARRAETRETALNLGIADAVFDDPAEAIKEADLVIFCVPVLTIPELAKACLPNLKPCALLTDVGSTKAELNSRMSDLLAGSGAEYIGSHPICGSEKQGIEAGDADLYEGAVTVVTPAMLSTDSAAKKVAGFWKKLGAEVRVMDAETHDMILAGTSHLPHMIAAALVFSAGDNGTFCGSGFRDTTRIAEGSPQVWSDIVRTNRSALKKALYTFRDQLDSLEMLIDEGDGEKVANWFAAARDKRKELLG